MKYGLPQIYGGFPKALTEEQFFRLVRAGHVVDGRAGGLIVGRSYDFGGIVCVVRRGKRYDLESRVEGGEFLMNAEASCWNFNRLRMIASDLLPAETDEKLPDVNLITTTAQPHDRVLLIDAFQTAISATIAKKHLIELFRLNRERNPFLACDLMEALTVGAQNDEVPM